jgi:AraC-like DNA-binding protein
MYKEYGFKNKELFYKHVTTPAKDCSSFAIHTHNMYELLYFVGGNAVGAIEDKRYRLKKGDLMLIRPMKYHFIEIDPTADYERYDILFDERSVGIRFTDMIPDGTEIINIGENPTAADIFKKLDIYYSKLSRDDFSDVLPILIKELFYSLKIAQVADKREIKEINPTVSAALRYINNNLFTLKSISEVAEALFITESYLYRIFKSELHKSPKKYINDKRLLAAQSLIQMGEKPTEIYERCGFSDYTAFFRSYKEYFGYSPSKEQDYTYGFEDTH